MWKFIAAFCLAFTFAAAARAEAPACVGQNLLEKIKAEDPKAYGAIIKEAEATPNGEAVLWRIAGRDGAADSYLFGTAHVTDPRVTTLPAEADKALSGAKIVALELKEAADPRALASAALRLAPLMAMPLGEGMWDLIPDEAEAVIRKNPNMPKGRAAVFNAYQPWVVAVTLSLPACEQTRVASGLAVLDQSIGQRALAQGAELVGLETVEEQLKVFAAMPMQQQVDYLMATARLGDLMPDYLETMIQLYASRQVTALMPMSKHIDAGDAKSIAVMTYIERNLIEKRNRTMANRAAQYLKRGNVFIAVGVLHLPGQKGLVALLREAGYTLTPVN